MSYQKPEKETDGNGGHGRIKPQHCWNRLEYFEEIWGPEETFYLSDFSENTSNWY